MHRYQNDYEIIYLIREGDDNAFQFMVSKYHPLIAKNIRKFHLAYMYDDIYQDALMCLHKSIFAYDPTFKKTFTRYFELNLTRMMITTIARLKRRTWAHQMHEDALNYRCQSTALKSPYFKLYLEEIKACLTPKEYDVFCLSEIQRASVQFISEKLGCEEKSVYNTLYRAKRKIKALYDDEVFDKAKNF
jgi:RNA polymerase sporulation-specific sigma factor